MEGSKKDANYIKIKLVGKTGNTMAIGAKIDLWAKESTSIQNTF